MVRLRSRVQFPLGAPYLKENPTRIKEVNEKAITYGDVSSFNLQLLEQNEEIADVQAILAELNEEIKDYPAAFEAYKARLSIYPTDLITNQKLTELYIKLKNQPKKQKQPIPQLKTILLN